MPYCLYLRKSRADIDAEARGERETLARHERTLLNLAKRLSLNVTEIYREVVSGETIAARPVMQQLLSEVEHGIWDGVLVMEVERLARGDTIDQGLVAQAFKFSNTKIITPAKTYDPNNEFDEEYFEFGLFMSRREYKTIRRRLEAGTLAAMNEGRWVHSVPPIGYQRVRAPNGKGFTLEIVEDEARIVRLIFDMYAGELMNSKGEFIRLGFGRIATKLNDMAIPTSSPKNQPSAWNNGVIRQILLNPTYAGYISYNETKIQKTVVDNQIKRKRIRNPRSDWILVEGLHPAIIDRELFWRVQDRIAAPPNTIPNLGPLKNPLASILKCGVCGRTMIFLDKKVKHGPTFNCPNANCPTVSNYAIEVFDRIESTLESWANGYFDSNSRSDSQLEVIQAKEAELAHMQESANGLHSQMTRAYDLLEQGIYDADTFLSRSRILASQIASLEKKKNALSAELSALKGDYENYSSITERAQHVLEIWRSDASAREKNDALKTLVEKIVYTKTKWSPKGGPYTNFDLEFVPKLNVKR